jgi:hypothetical protein
MGAVLSNYDDVQVVNGRHNFVRTRWFNALGDDVIAMLIKAFESRTSRFSSVVCHHFHGAASRVPSDATAFGTRTEHFTAFIYSAWEQDDDARSEQHRAWGNDLSSQLAPLALSGGYANLLATQSLEQIEAAYGDNAPRLREVKLKYDPTNTFSSAIPLPR